MATVVQPLPQAAAVTTPLGADRFASDYLGGDRVGSNCPSAAFDVTGLSTTMIDPKG